jgi:hypothetical protein
MGQADTWICELMTQLEEEKDFQEMGNIFLQLAIYSYVKQHAKKALEQGKQDTALMFSNLAYTIYQALPDRAKWKG